MTTHIHSFGTAALLLTLSVAAAPPAARPTPDSPYPEIPAQAVAGHGPFAIRGYHQHIFPDRQPMSVFHERLEQLARLDYNLVVFGMGTPGVSPITMHRDGSITPIGCDTEAMRALVAHAVSLRLEPVFEMKFIGKQLPLLRELLEDHPGLVIDPKNRATVLNAAYRMPDGRDAYSATALPLVDYLLGLYPENHPPKYFHFGIDEFDADDMAVLADSLNMTPPQAFAHCLNLGTDAVLARGVTPIIWGDILLSADLGGPEHGITTPGFRPDPRHLKEPGRAYHGDYKSGKITLHTMVNYLRDREKIIVADWHYAPSVIGEFPSVDYFLDIGFKDVWGCPWFNAVNLRQFSRYTASRGCGGMLATAWHMAYLPLQRLRLQHILRNSSAYFHNPGLEPPAAQAAVYRITGRRGMSAGDEKRTGIVVRDDLTLTFTAPVPGATTPRDAVLFVSPRKRDATSIKTDLTFDPDKRELNAAFALPDGVAAGLVLQLSYGYVDATSGYFVQRSCPEGLIVVDTPPRLPEAAPGILLRGDFGGLADPRLLTTIWLGGECATPVGAARPRQTATPPRGDGLDTQWFDRLWAYPSAHLNEALTRGMRIDVEVRMTDGFTGNDYCALFTKGSFSTGFRVLVRKDDTLLFQFANLDDGQPLWVHSKMPLPRDQWVSIVLLYRPPVGDTPGEAVIRFGDIEQARTPVLLPMAPSPAVIGIGCEFTNPVGGPKGKRRPNFPGLIRSFALSQIK